MYSMEDIFARLQQGETAESIANEMADAINAAVAKLEEEKVKASQEKEKKAAAQMAADGLNELIKIYDLTNERLKAEDVIVMMDSAVTLRKELEDLTKATPTFTKSADRTLDDFLKSWGLK